MTESTKTKFIFLLMFPWVALLHFLVSSVVLGELFIRGETSNPQMTLGTALLCLAGWTLGYSLHIVDWIESLVLLIGRVRLFPVGDWWLHMAGNSFVWTTILFSMPCLWRRAARLIAVRHGCESRNQSQYTDSCPTGTAAEHESTLSKSSNELRIRIHGDASLPTLIYLPGMHGDWTLVSSFRAAIAGKARFVEFTYPRTTTGTLDDLAREIEEALLANGVPDGWLIGESFGSQPAWQVIKRFQDKHGAIDQSEPTPGPSSGGELQQARTTRLPSREGTEVGPPIDNAESRTDFRPLGLILVGGFVRHPVNWAVRITQRVSARVPMPVVKLFCAVYARYAKFRHKHAPETLACVNEFVVNRTNEADRQAIVGRYAMIADNDLRLVARRSHLPVFYLAGSVDPLVPWPVVRWWLRRNCPGYRGGKTIWRADHNALGTAPQKSVEQILRWISDERFSQRDIGLPIGPRRRSANLSS